VIVVLGNREKLFGRIVYDGFVERVFVDSQIAHALQRPDVLIVLQFQLRQFLAADGYVDGRYARVTVHLIPGQKKQPIGERHVK